MKLISKYLFKNLTIYAIYSFIILISIYSIFEIILEIGLLGQAQYNLRAMLLSILFLIPTYAYNIFPIAILIASILYLSRLASLNEYAMIRVSGYSVRNLILNLLIFAFIFTIFEYINSEFIIPKSQKIAEKIKTQALYGNFAYIGKTNVWLKMNNEIITIGEALPDLSLKYISRRYIKDYKLYYMAYAEEARFIKDGTWELINLRKTIISKNKTKVIHKDKEIWDSGISYNLLDVLIHKPSTMSIYDLFQYVRYLKKENQKTYNYELEFWRKLFYPLISFIMVIMALSFTPVITRYSNIGLRVFLGISLGILFIFISRFFTFYSQLFYITPILGALFPLIIFLILSVICLKYNLKLK